MMASMRSRSPLARVLPGLSGLDAVVVAGAHDQVAAPRRRAAGDGHRLGAVDEAEAEQVLPDAAGQFPAQGVVGRDQQRVGVAGGQGGVVGGGGLDHQLRVPAGDPAVPVVFVQDGGVAVAEPQAGGALPRGAEPHRLGQPDVAEAVGEQGHAAAVLHGLELLGVARDDDLAAVPLGQVDQVGQVRAGHHRRLVDREEGALADGHVAPRAAPAGQVAEEPGAVVGLDPARGQGVARRLRRGDADDRAEARLPPRSRDLGQDPGLARPGGRVDHRHAPAVGQHRQRGRGLVLAQPGTGARVCVAFRVVRVSGQRALEPREVRAERGRGGLAGHPRRGRGLRLRDHALLHRQLRARGVADAAVTPVHAAAVRADQVARQVDRVGGLQAQDRVELRAQDPVRGLLQQPGRGFRVPAGAGQDPAQVLDQVRPGPRGLLLLRQRQRPLRRAGQREVLRDRVVPRRRVRASASGSAPARCASACQTDGATDASGTPSVRASRSAQPACACARSSAPSLPLRVAKFDACASCASSRCDGARPYRSSNRAARSRTSAVIAWRREENRSIISCETPLISNPFPSSRAAHSRPNRAGQRLLQVLGGDRGHRADVLAVAQGVRGAPLPVHAGPGDVGDLRVDVQLHVAVARGVLQPVRHRQVRLTPLARLPAAGPGVVRAGAGVARLPLEVAEARVHRLP